ncbi:MAG TPA: sigma-70 family RNA polymerase sigma factor [Candidatus Cybelea sp.]|jgi:RNA polymerase sigma-70 factor (ECF subfamily)|nr:sigma-70 family RNA polymerase sigma factor [Candidatus Cybelea sp.]
MKGDEAQHAFVTLLERHRGILHKIASAYAREAAGREDLRQEIVLQLWRSFPRFDARSKFSTWMYRVALNVAISYARRRRGEGRIELAAPAAIETVPGVTAPPADDRLDAVLAFVNRLDELNRALMLLYLDDYPHAEIATILGISPSNVATKIARIKERLRRDIAAQPPSQ